MLPGSPVDYWNCLSRVVRLNRPPARSRFAKRYPQRQDAIRWVAMDEESQAVQKRLVTESQVGVQMQETESAVSVKETLGRQSRQAGV